MDAEPLRLVVLEFINETLTHEDNSTHHFFNFAWHFNDGSLEFMQHNETFNARTNGTASQLPRIGDDDRQDQYSISAKR